MRANSGENRKKGIALMAVCLLLAGCGTDPGNAAAADAESRMETETGAAETAGQDQVQTESTALESRAEETVPPEPEIVTFTLSAAGDVSLGNLATHGYSGTFREMYDKEGRTYFLQNVKDIFSADDMTLVNFEGVLTFSDDLVEKEFNIKGDPEYIGILTEGSVEAVSFGNNHHMDYGQQGNDDTVALFEENEIAYAYDSYIGIYEAKGIRVGFVSVNEVYDGEAVESYLEEGIRCLRVEEQVNLVIACCHWGEESRHYPEKYQETLGRKCIDWGADLVLGAHAHVLQGIEVYQGRFIVYGLGNFCFGGNRNPKNKDSMIFQQTFTFVDGVLQEGQDARVIPCSISSVSSRNDFCPTPSQGDEYDRILGTINEYSVPYGTVFDGDGVYVPSAE